jgi:hypothetical protein
MSGCTNAAAFTQDEHTPHASSGIIAGSASPNKDGALGGFVTFSQTKYCDKAMAIAKPPDPSLDNNNKAWLKRLS